jgi:plasmid stability protein
MTVLTIELPDEQKAALVAKAQAHGLSTEEYVRRCCNMTWRRKSWESAREAGLDQLSMEEIDSEIAAARKARRAPRFHPDT